MAGFFGYVSSARSAARSEDGSSDGSGPIPPGSGTWRNPSWVEPNAIDETISSDRAYFIGTS